MIKTISNDYLEMNRQLHKEKPTYGASGHKHWKEVLTIMRKLQTVSVLDYGCGKGTLRKAISLPITEYDPAIPGKDKLADHDLFDIVVCTDVLEHVEPDSLDHVLLDIWRHCRMAAYIVISTREAKKLLPDGRNAHLNVHDEVWWQHRLRRHFQVNQLHFEQNDGELLFVGVPRS